MSGRELMKSSKSNWGKKPKGMEEREVEQSLVMLVDRPDAHFDVMSEHEQDWVIPWFPGWCFLQTLDLLR